MVRVLQKIFVISCCLIGLNMACVSASSLDTYIASLHDSLLFDDPTAVSTKKIIQKYCLALQENPSFVGDDFVYNSQQSAFVFLLCNHVGAVSFTASWFDASRFFQGTKVASNKWIFRATSLSGIGITDSTCASSTLMNGCDLSKVLPPLFTTIVNDYTNIKEASLYGVADTDLTKVESLANTFAANYFTPWLVLCGDTSVYPKTCRVMKNYIQSAIKTFANTTLFYPWALVSRATAAAPSCASTNAAYQLIPCGLLADKRDSLQGFTALMYNEQFYYRLFINYYTLIITANPQVISSNSKVISTDLFEKKTRFANELIWSQQTISSTIRSLRDIYASFPLHVWFMMYQEDIVSFGKRLAKLAEPLYTLYDKLRNVQQP